MVGIVILSGWTLLMLFQRPSDAVINYLARFVPGRGVDVFATL